MTKELQLVQTGTAEAGFLSHSPQEPKLSWEETCRQMAAEKEDWSDWYDLHDEDQL